MDLNASDVGYFIEQVGLAAASFGVAKADLTIVGDALSSIFNVRCAPPTTVIPAQGPQLQSICIADDCALAPNSTCAAYEAAVVPLVANVTLADGEGRNGTSSSSMMASSSTTVAAAGAASSSSAMAESSATATSAAASSGAAAAASTTVSEAASGTSTGLAVFTGAAGSLHAQVGAVLGGAALVALAL